MYSLALYAAPFLLCAAKPNVLLIMFDDLRDEMPPYVSSAHPLASINPAFNEFVAQSTAFHTRTAFTACAPSRASMLTGMRPDTTRLYTFEQLISQTNYKTIFGVLKSHGYVTATIGKVFHNLEGAGTDQIEFETNQTSIPREGLLDGNSECDGKMYCIDDSPRADPDILQKAGAFFRRFRGGEWGRQRPFFLGVGFHHPHIQNNVPRRFMINEANVSLPETFTPVIDGTTSWRRSLAYFRPHVGLMHMKVRTESGAWVRAGNPLRFFADPDRRRARRDAYIYYLSSVHYCMHLVTETLRLLREAELSMSTHVIVTSDHGWTIGDWGDMLSKNNMAPSSTNVPLLIHTAGQHTGMVNQGLASTIDIFPTIMGLTVGSRFLSALRLDGKSLLPALFNEMHNVNPAGVVTQYPRCQPLGQVQSESCMRSDIECGRPAIQFMGYTLETVADRITGWWPFFDMGGLCAAARDGGDKWREIGLAQRYGDAFQLEYYLMQNHARATTNIANASMSCRFGHALDSIMWRY